MASCSSSSTSKRPSSSSEEPATKRRILYSRSVDKWISENDKELQTSSWLKCDVVAREQVDCLKCSSVCTKFQYKLTSLRTITRHLLMAQEMFEPPILRIMLPAVCTRKQWASIGRNKVMIYSDIHLLQGQWLALNACLNIIAWWHIKAPIGLIYFDRHA